MSSPLASEQAAASRTLRVVVDAVERHHLQARELCRAAAVSIRVLGEERALPEWQPLLAAYHGLARALLRYLHDQEDLLLDRVEWLLAQRQLHFGALSDLTPYVERLAKHKRALLWHHGQLADELARSGRVSSVSSAGRAARAAIRAFAQAFVQHVDFEAYMLDAALEPFLTPRKAALRARHGSATERIAAPPAPLKASR